MIIAHILMILLNVLGIILVVPLRHKSLIYKYLNVFFITKIVFQLLNMLYSMSLSFIINIYRDFIGILGYVNIFVFILGCIPYCILIYGMYKVSKSSENLIIIIKAQFNTEEVFI